MAEPDIGWKLTWSDWAGFVEGRTRLFKRGQRRASLPKVHVETFRTKGAAEARKASLVVAGGDGVVATVVRVTLKPPKLAPALLADLPLMTKRLTK